MTSFNLYDAQFESSSLAGTANLVAVDLLGHGKTKISSGVEQFTYWDSAIMTLQLLDQLKIDKFFTLGTSQGGWMVMRLALLAPSRVLGVIALGTSMDSESQRTRDLGCWDIAPIGDSLISGWSSKDPTPDFTLDDGFVGLLVQLGVGPNADSALVQSMSADTKANYTGDIGRRRARMCAINLRDRDGLHGRLFDITCPVLWMHGSDDQVYSVANAREEIKLFVNSKEANVIEVKGGQHFLSASNPGEVEPKVIDFIKKLNS
ncbi:hypothetical protein LTR05_000389 [Lithohypha guttulata]|uniref:AB hydrolase-1 domain-containing protein n=1 Tax=Lithohypha guttulata TaxID=1690604 RepID=A0AAN7T4F9_9EURO|nr:hypothetical protein LTR05_000389 [Lithohypha guttulata]